MDLDCHLPIAGVTAASARPSHHHNNGSIEINSSVASGCGNQKSHGRPLTLLFLTVATTCSTDFSAALICGQRKQGEGR